MLYNLVRGPQVCQLFSCYVSPSINKVLIIIIIIMINQPNFVSSAMGALSSQMHGFLSVFILEYSPLPRITCTGSLAFMSLWLT